MAEIVVEDGVETLADIIREGLDLLFIGYNPSIPAMQRRHYYGNPRNRFWEDLYEAGLLPGVFRESGEDVRVLEFGIGLTDVVKRPSPNIDSLTTADFKAGFLRLDGLLLQYRPRIACFVGKGLGEMYRKWAPPPPDGVLVTAVPSTSGRNNGIRAERLAAFRALARLVEGPAGQGIQTFHDIERQKGSRLPDRGEQAGE